MITMRISFILIFFTIGMTAFGQKSYAEGDTISNFATPVVLNTAQKARYFSDLKGDITLIDFFGTWCVPCIKALPHLKSLQQQSRGKLKVVLISVESKERLQAFINKQKDFPFPVVVDEGEKISVLFQPPSYPYTVVIDKAQKVIGFPEATKITTEQILGWANHQTSVLSVDQQSKAPQSNATPMTGTIRSTNPLVQLSQDFVYAAKTKAPADDLLQQVKNIPFDSLQKQLATDAEKKAFWINLYNAFTQIILQKDPKRYQSRNDFFSDKQIEVAGKRFSLDDIEHGILRRSRIKWSLGYLNKPFLGKMEKALRVDTLDYRLHFALNCGAKSCPPIAFYVSDKIDQQLDLATKAYLSGEAAYDKEKNTVYLPAIMNWFRADFGGKKGMRTLLKETGIIPEEKKPKIRFKKYDWNLFLNNYTNDNQ